VLLAALRPAVYMPVDISREHLLESAAALAARFPSLGIRAACADYSVPIELPLEPEWRDVAAFFPGSSIGNFEPASACRLLQRIAAIVGPGGRLLIGVDQVKDERVLHAAYNDAQGVTAAFNLNLLTRINRELGADFDLARFRAPRLLQRRRKPHRNAPGEPAGAARRSGRRGVPFPRRRNDPHRVLLQVPPRRLCGAGAGRRV
jgi:uncharacterized SAM-dependent methyltransferase